MTRRVLVIGIAILMAATGCSSKASEGGGADDATTSAGETTSTSSGASTSDAATTVASETTLGTETTTAATPAPTTPRTTVPCRVPANFDDNVRRGDCGDIVETIQDRLSLLGFPAAVDGQFGPGTEQAVKDFQESRGLPVDGIVGPSTWEALVEGGIGD